MNTQFGRGRVGPSGNLEAELSVWLRGFEAGPMPIAARLRTSADLRKLEGRPSGAMPSLARGLGSLAASMVALAVAAFAIVGLMGGRIGGAVGVPGSVLPGQATNLPGSEQSAGGLGPLTVVLLVVMSALVGAAVYLRPVRRAAERLVGSADPVSVELLPLRRKLREIDIRTRVLAILPVGLVVWYALSYPIGTPLEMFLLVAAYLPATFAFAVAYRYRLRDRGSRLMFAGGLALLAHAALGMTWQAAGVLGLSEQVAGLLMSPALRIAQSALLALGYVALAAGVVGTSGVTRRPPLALSAAAVGTTFLLAAANFVQLASSPSALLPADQIPWLFVAATGFWINLLAWTAILWVGALAALRRRAPAAWRFVFVAGATVATTYFAALASTWLPLLGIGSAPDFTVWLVAESLAMGALLLALLAGLRPVTDGALKGLQPVASDGAPEPGPGTSQEIATP
ncbi:MAG: hypothetical protein ABSC46_05330 [Candidatus Limnocylindrales bacterium]